jgi:sulfhydrogenase subunit beta (sulfur reductase)
MRTLERERFDELIEALSSRGYEVVGPTVRQGAIAFEPVSSAADLPVGLTDEQEGGTYRLRERGDGALFGFANGPQSWKRILHPPAIRLWQARQREDGGGIEFHEDAADPPQRAFLGVRSCDIHAIAMLDGALLDVEHPDPGYRARREGTFIVALNCGTAGGTCFCVSMNTGPKATFGFDLALTEVIEPGRHYFLIEGGSERGGEVLEGLPTEEAASAERQVGEEIVARTAASMGRRMPVDDPRDLKDLLYRNFEHPRWEEVADRCLTCGNCTSVCPTCFCTDVDDVTDLTGQTSERWRRWDSCFTVDFTHVHGGSVRASSKSRYRQWMTHKLATWFEQFGTSGCVGCGRCITWCPVAIDITEEAAAIAATDGEGAERRGDGDGPEAGSDRGR